MYLCGLSIVLSKNCTCHFAIRNSERNFLTRGRKCAHSIRKTSQKASYLPEVPPWFLSQWYHELHRSVKKMNRKRLSWCYRKTELKLTLYNLSCHLCWLMCFRTWSFSLFFFHYESVNMRCKIKWKNLNILSIYNNVLFGSTLQLKIKLSVFMCSYVFLKNLQLSLCTYQLKTHWLTPVRALIAPQ